MKILPDFKIKRQLGTVAVAGTVLLASATSTQQRPEKFQLLENMAMRDSLVKDVFIKQEKLTPQGVCDLNVLRIAPNPVVAIMGESKIAAIVVDLSQNVLYRYNEFGEPTNAYIIASGKKNSPTNTGVRVVTHIERYPYKSAPAHTKRRKRPNDYGPRIICLEKINPQTGEKSSTGEFIHGNNNPASLGKYASLGCIRMDNNVIKELASQIKRGDIVIITE